MNTKFKPTHGLSNHRIYGIWRLMLSRCNNPNDKNFKRYGQRGIYICPEWQNEQGLINFYNWSINNNYDKNLSIDRIDNNGNYCPQNCCWANKKSQANNRRTNTFIELNGQKRTLQQWCDIYNISPSLVNFRIKSGLPIEQCFKFPIRELKDRTFEFNGKSHNIAEWAEIMKVPYVTLYKRMIRHNWIIEEALAKPFIKKHRKSDNY